jgi:hypothetical protein
MARRNETEDEWEICSLYKKDGSSLRCGSTNRKASLLRPSPHPLLFVMEEIYFSGIFSLFTQNNIKL